MPSAASHLRAPLLWILLPFIAGLSLAKTVPVTPIGAALLLVLALTFATSAGFLPFAKSIRAQHAWWPCIIIAAGLCGFLWLHLRHPDLLDSTERPPREVTVTVEVLQVYPTPPAKRSITGLATIIEGSALEPGLQGKRIYFSALQHVSLPPEKSGHYRLRGVIEPLPARVEPNSFEDYLVNQGVRETISRAQFTAEVKAPHALARFFSKARIHCEALLAHGLEKHPEVRSLYLGMVLGSKASLSTDQQNAFMRSGTFHIFSVSGLHVGVISIAIYALLQLLRVPRRHAVAACLALLWIYVQITGASTPAQRAFLMIAALLSSQIFRLPGNGLAALSASALITLLFDPLQLFSTGFQMSYSVVTALVLMAMPLSQRWQSAWQPFAFLPRANWAWYQHTIAWLGKNALLSGAACWVAFLISLPSSIGYFQVFSPGSLLANTIIIPLSTLALISGFCSLLIGLCGLTSLNLLFNSAAGIILYVMNWLVLRGTPLPGAYFDAQFRQPWMAPLGMALIIGVMLAGSAAGWRKRYGGFWPPAVAGALILIFCVKFGAS